MLEEYVNFVDSTTKKNQSLKKLYSYLLLLHLCFYFFFCRNTYVNKTFSLKQISKTGNFDPNLTSRQNNFYLMACFMEIKSVNPRLRQYQIEKELGCSITTLNRYKNDANMLSPWRIPPKNQKRRQKISNTNIDDNSNREHDVQRRQMTSIDLAKPDKKTELTVKRTYSLKRNKNVLKVGFVHQNSEINDEYLDEMLRKNNV